LNAGEKQTATLSVKGNRSVTANISEILRIRNLVTQLNVAEAKTISEIPLSSHPPVRLFKHNAARDHHVRELSTGYLS
jgi:hypothetical protein